MALAQACSARWPCRKDCSIDCSPINPGGQHYEPNDIISHCDWVFSSYFQRWKMEEGEAACFIQPYYNLQEVGELIRPNQTSLKSKRKSSVSVDKYDSLLSRLSSGLPNGLPNGFPLDVVCTN